MLTTQIERRFRRAVIAAASTALAAAALTACGSSPSTPGSSGTAKLGGTLSIGLGSLPVSEGNPFGATYAGPAVETWAAMFDALTDTSPQGATPALATSWKLVSPTTWQFTLRKGVKFSDGETFNASAAAFTFNYISSAAGAKTAIGGSFPQIAGAKVVSPYVVDILTKAPDPILPREIVQVNIVAPNAWQRLGASGYALHPVGTGPYQVTSWGPTSVSLTRFAGSWRPGHYAKLNIIETPDVVSRYQALQSGQIQVDYDISQQQITQTKSASNLTLLTEAAGKEYAIQYLDTPGSPLLNADVRQAISLAVNRSADVSAVLGSLTQPAYQGASPGDSGYDSSLPAIAYDPAKAKTLLAQAGYPHGFSFSVAVAEPSVAGSDSISQLAAADLARIGVKMTLISVPYATWLDDFLSGHFNGEQATSIAYSDAPDFDAALALDRGSCLELPAVLWCQQDQATVLKQINSTTDLTTRDQLFDQVAQMERTNPPALFLFNMINTTAVSSSVHASYLPIGAINFSAVAPS
jgi:peptide/nickel transport system substrate-binding protein